MLGLRTLEMLAAIIILNYKHLHHHHHPDLRYNHLSHLERVIKTSQLILNVNYLYFIGCVFVDTDSLLSKTAGPVCWNSELLGLHTSSPQATQPVFTVPPPSPERRSV